MKSRLLISLSLVSGAAVYAAPVLGADINSRSLEQRLINIERSVKARTRSQHDMQDQLDELQEEVRSLRGSLEQHNFQLEKILQRQRELYLEIDKRMASISGADPQSSDSQVVSIPLSEEVEADEPTTEYEAYVKAVNLILRQKEYDKAIPEFRTFLEKYPNSRYTDNAHYWLGQLLFNKQDWAGANNEFSLVVESFPDSTKRADAILKLGIIETRRGNLAKAKQLFEQVQSEYPQSTASKMAQKRVNDLVN
jgi:tol-pal system protein YbgF